MSYACYPEMTDSGLAHIGRVPSHWAYERAKFLFRRMNRPVRESDEIVTAFRNGEVTLRKNRREEGFTNALKEIGYQGIRKGDLVIHAMDGFAGAIGVSDSDGKSSPVYSACVPTRDEVVPEYYACLLRDLALNGFVESLAKGVRERSTEFRFAEFKELTLPVPPHKEQAAIVDFLDRETAKIDTLIDKQEQLIKLLEEKRQAVISHAVIKGLNPDVRMKDSGVEWLGVIPEHWEIRQLRHITQTAGGGTPSKDRPEFWGGSIPWISPKDMKRDLLESSEDTITPTAVANSAVKLLPPGCLLVVVRGMILVHSAPVGLATREFTINQDMKAFRPTHATTSDYLLFLMKGLKRRLLELVEDSAHGTKKLNTDKLERLPLPIPPEREQKEILGHLRHRTEHFDILKNAASDARTLLMERRTALISAAVTGKIDVRSAV